MNKKFQDFIEPIVDDQGRQIRPENNRLFKKKDIDKATFLRYFFGNDVGRSTQGTRKTSLINALAIALSRNYVIEFLEVDENIDRVEEINEFLGYEKSDNYLSRVVEALDLNPDHKLSIADIPNNPIVEIENLKNVLRENGKVKGGEIKTVLEEYKEELDETTKVFMQPILEEVEKIYEKYGAITMSELAEAIDSKFGRNIDFTFFDNFKKALKEITDGEVTLFNLDTKLGEKEFFELVEKLTNTMDPRFLKLQSVVNFFTASGTINGFSSGTYVSKKSGKTKKSTYGVKFIKNKFGINEAVVDFGIENVSPLKVSEEKQIEDMIIAWNKNTSINHNSNIEKKKLADQINDKFNLNERRDGIEGARDYLYSKLNNFINQHKEGTTERLKAIAFVAKLLQLQTSAKSGLSRQGAFLSSVTLDYSTTEKSPFRWEHNIQLLNFNANVLKSMIDGKFEERYDVLSSNYTQTLLDKDAQIFLDGKEMPTEAFKAKYNVDYAEIEKIRGNTSGVPGFTIGMESEAMFIIALGNASRTLNLETGITMDQLIYNKINTKRSIDYLDGVAERIRMNIPVSPNSDLIFNPKNKDKIFNNTYNADLFNDIITLAIIGDNVSDKIELLANRIKEHNKKENNSLEEVNTITNKNTQENEEQRKKNEVVKLSLSDVFNGASVFDFDLTVGQSDNVVIATKDGITKTLDGVQWAKQGDALIKQGWKMDFSDFNNITNGTLGPLWPKLINQLDKYGSSNVHILTARAPEVQEALLTFINEEIDKYNAENGTSIPRMVKNNIIGLGDSTGEAKADWIKNNLILNGFNDIYFVDDVLENVQAVQDMYDEFPPGTIKDGGKSVIVETSGDLGKYSLSDVFNDIVESSSKIEAIKKYSDVQAKLQGKKKWWQFNILFDPGAEDFKGLIYPLLGEGKEGEEQWEWFKENLINPYDIGVAEIDKSKVRLMNRYKDLLKSLPKIKRKLKDKIERSDGKKTELTVDNAIRAYVWTKNGVEVPGISQRDLDLLISYVENNPDLKTFANALSEVSEGKYIEPSVTWILENIASDIKNMSNLIGRKEHLEVFIKNKDEIFSKENLNKLEVIQGTEYREALEEMLYRMEYGTNYSPGRTSKQERAFDEWVNNSVGAIMFLNMRSATLQLLSTTNFIDWKYNNPLKAAQAFANLPLYIKTVVEIWNSEWMQERAGGARRTVNEAELAAAVEGAKNPVTAMIAYLLEKGFTPTSIADRLAIVLGGSTFLINGKQHYLDQGLSLEEANAAAWLDLQQKAKESQQSSDPRFISSIQAGTLGKVIFAFKNTPMQYTRLMKRSLQDLIKGRGNPAEHVAKIAYYGAVQNFMFSALQTALFAALGDSDPEWEKKEDRVIQSMIDSILNGLGLKGAIIVTVKNGVLQYFEQEEKGWNADHTYTILQFANFSPTIGSKLRKIYGAIVGKKYNEEEIAAMSLWDPRNPAWASVCNLIEGFTNLPTARVHGIINNLLAVSSSENEFMDNLMLVLGWNVWDIGVETKVDKVSKELDDKKEKEKEKEKKEKKETEIKKDVIEEKEENKDVNTCSAVNSQNVRCKNKVDKAGDKCAAHGGGGKQCSFIKPNSKRCKLLAVNNDGRCNTPQHQVGYKK